MSAPDRGCRNCGESIAHLAKQARFCDNNEECRTAYRRKQRGRPGQIPNETRRLSRVERREELRGELLTIQGAERALDKLQGERARRHEARGQRPECLHGEAEKEYSREQAALYASVRGAKSRIADLLSRPLAGQGIPPAVSAAVAKWLGLGDFPLRLDRDEDRKLAIAARRYGFPSLSTRQAGAGEGATREKKKTRFGLRGGDAFTYGVERRRAAARQALAEAGPKQAPRSTPLLDFESRWKASPPLKFTLPMGNTPAPVRLFPAAEADSRAGLDVAELARAA